ncbi:MAG: oligosaccharide flippase family protein [Caldilineales bacterium]|nr:oligosaccharide flippase family protein [Caldilineales bacterium]
MSAGQAVHRGAARRVGRNALARLAAQAWARGMALAITALVARAVGPQGLGQYALTVAVVGVAGAVADLGLNIYLTRQTAQTFDRAAQQRLFSDVFWLKLALATAGWLALASAAAVASAMDGRLGQEIGPLLLLGGLALWPEAAMGAMAALIVGRGRMEISSAAAALSRTLALVASAVALRLGQGVGGVLVGSALASLVGALTLAGVLARWRALPQRRLSPAAWRSALAEAYPFALTGIIAMVYMRVDVVLLGWWRGAATAGWYSAGYRLWEAMGLIPGSLLDALFPELSRLWQADRRGLERLVPQARRAMAVGSVALALAAALASGWLIALFYGDPSAYAPARAVFLVLVWALPATFLYLLSGHLLYAAGQQRAVTRAMAAVALLNLVLNLWAIPRWGALGAAAVALASEWTLWALLAWQVRRRVRYDSP